MDFEIENEIHTDVLVTSNMASAPRDMLIAALHPGFFSKNDDVEAFISKCNKYFDASGTHKSARSLLVIGLISKDLRDKYEATENLECKSYEERMRKAFTKTQTLVQDMEAALRFRRNGEDTDGYVKKIKSLVDKLLKHSYDREVLEKELLIHCCNDVEIRREVKMKECGSAQEIIETFKKIERVREETEQVEVVQSCGQNISAIGARVSQGNTTRPSYRDMLKGASNQRPYVPSRQTYEPRSDHRNGQYRTRGVCWTCNEEGHFSRECVKRVITCHACGKQGHIRRYCPNIKCGRCDKNGHHKEHCRTNLDRRNYRGPYYKDERQGEPYVGFRGNRYDSRPKGSNY